MDRWTEITRSPAVAESADRTLRLLRHDIL